eukprot:gene2918-11891_t
MSELKFEAELRPARLLKQLIGAVKEVVVEVLFECSQTEFVVVAMDSSHVSLVCLILRAEWFQSYCCERAITMGVNVGNLWRILEFAADEDTVKLTAQPGSDLSIRLAGAAGGRVNKFSMRLIEIDGEALGIPEQYYPT